MINHFLLAWAETLGIEGDYSNNADDPGGATRWGITESVARYYGYIGPMSDLPIDRAQAIAKVAYWDVLKLDDVAFVSAPVARELFDTSYNCGVGTAGKFLQQALNAFNRQGSDYPDLIIDGRIGQATIAALQAFMDRRGSKGETVLIRALNALQGARYLQVIERKPALETFVFGWFVNRVG